MVWSGSDGTEALDPEVVPLARRRRFSAGEKLRIVEEADTCTEPGEIGALLRREGVYSSYLSRWRRARDLGRLDGLGPAKAMHEQRCQVLAEAYAAHPERFVRGEPIPPLWPEEVWINPPQSVPDIADDAGTGVSETGPRRPSKIRVLLPKFERELSQSH